MRGRTRLWLSPEGIYFVGSSLNYWNYKYQITNTKQFPMTEIRKSKPISRPGRFWSLNIDGFVKSAGSRHSRRGGSPELFEITGFPPSREWQKRLFLTSYEGINIRIWDLFEICLPAVFLAGCLEFVILNTKLQGRAGYLWLGPEDQVFQD